MHAFVAVAEVNRLHISTDPLIVIFTADDVEHLACAAVVALAVICGKITQRGNHASEQEVMRFLFYRYMGSGARLAVLMLHLDQNGSLSIPIDLRLCTVQRLPPLLADPDPAAVLPDGIQRQGCEIRGEVGGEHIVRVPVPAAV